jgi:mannose-6-phosphate isomerase-like protein (cupin superfamily)
MRKINLRDAFTRFDEAWSPRVAGTVNGVDVRLAKLRGEFLWHRHDDEDELFLVCEGELLMKLRDGEHVVGGGEMILIPRGTDHMPGRERAHAPPPSPARDTMIG